MVYTGGVPNEAQSCDATAEPIYLRVASKLEYACGIREMVVTLCRRWAFDDATAGRVALAVDEAMTNVVRHGYKGSPEGVIEFRMRPLCVGPDGSETGVRITIEDRGEAVDPGTIQPRPLDEIRPGGLGVHIIREVMDVASYEAREGGGMRLVLEKSAGACGEEGASDA